MIEDREEATEETKEEEAQEIVQETAVVVKDREEALIEEDKGKL